MSNEDFVNAFSEMWQGRYAIDDLWSEDGTLTHPTLDRPISGKLVPFWERYCRAALPDLTWQLLSWLGQDNLVFIEWECRATVNNETVSWRGVDRFLLRNERIQEEVVYSDTMPLLSAIDPSAKRDALVQAEELQNLQSEQERR